MARIEFIEERLRNWARWKCGENISYAKVQLGEPPMPRQPYGPGAVPISDTDGAETAAAVQVLPTILRATVVMHYLAPGGHRRHLSRLGISSTTLYERIDQAHRLLASHFTQLHESRQAERKRVEELQATVRPLMQKEFYGADKTATFRAT